jgi:hypothetical protein
MTTLSTLADKSAAFSNFLAGFYFIPGGNQGLVGRTDMLLQRNNYLWRQGYGADRFTFAKFLVVGQKNPPLKCSYRHFLTTPKQFSADCHWLRFSDCRKFLGPPP